MSEKYASMEDAVLTKLRLSNSENKYKFIAQTDEGKLAKVADVLAYLPTDIQDGFRMRIITKFNDEYLELFGAMFAPETNLSRNAKIAFAKDMLDTMKKERLRELKSDMIDPENQGILKHVDAIIRQAQEQGVNIDALSNQDKERLNEITEAKI